MTTNRINFVAALGACALALAGCGPAAGGQAADSQASDSQASGAAAGNGPAPVTALVAASPIVEYRTDASRAGAIASAIVGEQARLITIDGFGSRALGNSRSIYVYLPPAYHADAGISYPVLYVQDGKAAFYDSDWSKESLSMHIKADALIRAGSMDAVVIVGVSNAGEQRASEYAHWDGVDWGRPVKGRGLDYEEFLMGEVMPFIEANFRVRRGKEATAIMGASLGGLVAFNIAMRHPEAFSGLAAQSAFLGWGERRLLSELRDGEYRDKRDLRIWLDVSAEEADFKADIDEAVDILEARGYARGADLAYRIDPKGRHSEGAWATRVEDALLFLYGTPD